MTLRISSQRRVLSKDARRRMGEAGRHNLAGWRARARQRASELDAEVNAFRSGLLRDAGANPSASRIGLIEAAVSTYAGVLKIRYVLINSRRSDVGELSERVSWLTGNLSRLLKTLNLDARPRPRCLADLIAPKVGQTGEIAASNPPIPVESRGNTP